MSLKHLFKKSLLSSCVAIGSRYKLLINSQKEFILAIQQKDRAKSKEIRNKIRNELKQLNLLLDEYFEQRQDWQIFYKELLNKELNFSELRIPSRTEQEKKEFTRLLIIPQDLTIQQVFSLCSKQFLCETDKQVGSDLDKITTVNDRVADQSYAIWLKDTQEADEVNKDKSALDLEKNGFKGITLLERLVLELKYFKETGNHLDLNNKTLCSGSRFLGNPGSPAPIVSWKEKNFFIDWFNFMASRDYVRAREVISN